MRPLTTNHRPITYHKIPDDSTTAVARFLHDMESPQRIQDNVKRLYYQDTERRRIMTIRTEQMENQRHPYAPTTSALRGPLRDMDPDALGAFVARVYDKDLRRRRQHAHELEQQVYPQSARAPIGAEELKDTVERLYERPMRVKKTVERQNLKKKLKAIEEEQHQRRTWCVKKIADPKGDDAKMLLSVPQKKSSRPLSARRPAAKGLGRRSSSAKARDAYMTHLSRPMPRYLAKKLTAEEEAILHKEEGKRRVAEQKKYTELARDLNGQRRTRSR